MTAEFTLIRAALVVDGERVHAAPGALLLRSGVVVAAGAPDRVDAPAGATIIERPDAVVIPALVNAHTHLDLTHLERRPFGGDFVTWADGVRKERATDPAAIADATRAGIRLARLGGTALVGDIAGAGSCVPRATMIEEGLGGVSYQEHFGIGRGRARGVEALRGAGRGGVGAPGQVSGGVMAGVQPHAPYSCAPEVYDAAARLGCPLSTHLAETPEELEFCAHATGPFAGFLRHLGLWDETVRPPGGHPVDVLLRARPTPPCVAVHLNYASARHFERLAEAGVAVAYCPRASAYFGHPRGDHPPHGYRAMIDAGVEVALGTDGLSCLDRDDRLSVLDEMRFLHARDGTDPRRLLRLGTTAGARALGLDPRVVSFAVADVPSAGVLAVPLGGRCEDPLRAIMAGDDAPEWIVGPVAGDRLVG